MVEYAAKNILTCLRFKSEYSIYQPKHQNYMADITFQIKHELKTAKIKSLMSRWF
jgi:hypothetical protein